MNDAIQRLKLATAATATAAILAMGAAAPVKPQTSGDPITFGFFGPLTGKFGANGERFKEAIELFVEQTNANGGIGGHELVVKMEDDRGDPLQSTAIAQKYVADDSIRLGCKAASRSWELRKPTLIN